jgi:2-oxoglutarate dehydrogenase E1 component
MEAGSAFSRSNFTYITEIYKKYLQNPSSVDASWDDFFKNLSDNDKTLIADAQGSGWELEKSQVIGKRNEFSSLPLSEVNEIISLEKASDKKKKEAIAIAIKEGISGGNSVENAVEKLLENYRIFGHLSANLDPLSLKNPEIISELSIENHKIKKEDFSKEVSIFGLKAKVSDIISHFQNIYSGNLGAEINHIKNTEERKWLYEKMENYTLPAKINEIRQEALHNLIKAEAFEQAIHVKFPGAKRFSIEGGEAAIVSLEKILLTSSENGISEVIMGMAHRGRLNILTHVFGKPYHAIFSEFMGVSSIPENIPGSGDVKYHLGFNNKRVLSNGKEVKLSLTPNPSHLEAVNSVVMGRVRAKQDNQKDINRNKILGILIHGDAAMAGQGVVAECLAMSNLKGYTTGGTIHIIINNQVGFTAIQKDTKSGTYSSDVAKMIDAPIFHVNGNDIESVMKASVLIAEYRQKFLKDVVLEIVCYRKYGHNEGDEPMFTQPKMYSKVKSMETPATIYAKELASKKIILEEFESSKKNEIKAILDAEYEKAKTYKPQKADWLEGKWSHIKRLNDAKELFAFKDTKISEKTFDVVGGAISMPPEKFILNSKIKKMLEERKMALLSGDKIDWATAELLAYGSLMLENSPVRLSGEDCERGTFSHRHSVYYDQETNERFEPLNNIKAEKIEKYEVLNSLLSEFAVLGFEYGYSLETPNTLTIWEAQFGDFANGAVTIYDQFISSGEDKWLKMSGIVSLLPHGFEGQGPEHSSARLERYLQYCAENNMIVCNITTPANLFHLLRRQVKMPFRKPLVIMSPKSLLRHKLVNSPMKEFTGGEFKPIISEEENKKTAKKIIFTSGKIYYDAFEERENLGKKSEIAIIRIEQYYPFDTETLKKEVSEFKSAKEFIWLQEEPKNMGAWSFVRDYLSEVCGKIVYVGRDAKPSPATGFASVHAKEQVAIISQALK